MVINKFCLILRMNKENIKNKIKIERIKRMNRINQVKIFHVEKIENEKKGGKNFFILCELCALWLLRCCTVSTGTERCTEFGT